MYKIYFIINNVNKYLYIGSTHDFEKRKEQHIYELENKIHHNIFLQQDFDEFGLDAFTFKIHKEYDCTREEILRKEYGLIGENKSNCYNIAFGEDISRYNRYNVHPSKRGHNDKEWTKILPKNPIYDIELIDEKTAKTIITYRRKEACYMWGITCKNYEILKLKYKSNKNPLS